MALTTTTAGSLVGAMPAEHTMAQPTTRKIRVNRPFMFEGKRREVGEEFSVPAALAFELFTANKAEATENEPSELHLAAKADAEAKAKALKAAAKAATAPA